MKVLFAVHEEKVSLSIVKKYQKEYKEIISYKNVYYFNAILKELQRDKSYDRVVIDEELEEFTSSSYEEKDRFIFNKLDNITDEASNAKGKEIPIILICSERRTKSEDILVKMFGIGIYNAIIGGDRSTDEVCRLINQPRSKKEAKIYYRIDSKDLNYDPESINDVSEEEMQNILGYFKRLGKNEEKYVEVFRKINSQYNEKQMRVIIAILPINVKSILEENSPEYQRLVTSGGGKIEKRAHRGGLEAPTSETLLDAGDAGVKASNKQIVVPSSMNKNIKKITLKKPTTEPVKEEIEEIEEVVEEPKKKRRGRPPKKNIEEPPIKLNLLGFDEDDEETKQEEKQLQQMDDFFEVDDNLYDNKENSNNDFVKVDEEEKTESILPGFEEDDDDNDTLPELDDIENASLPGIEEEDYDEDYEDNEYEEADNEDKYEFDDNQFDTNKYTNRSFSNNEEVENELPEQDSTEYEEYNNYDYSNYNNLLTSDKKIVAFVGTSKNGTSFIVNNIAQILAESGINTAILDATLNKNSYYIYNSNDDELREEAAVSIENLIHGKPGGMKVSENLSVYVEIPGQMNSQMTNSGPILENLARNHSVVLIDCDFNTPTKYFENAQEIYLVQSMDILTIQPLTAFLKELKNKEILDQRKLKIIVNKSVRLKGIDAGKIVGGMSKYNNPEMSIMTDLFDRRMIAPIEIPFDQDVYERYLEGIADCNIMTKKYPKEFQSILKKLSAVIYPLLPGKNKKEKPQKGYQYQQSYSNGFSNSVNNTLNNMKRKY